MNQQSLQEAAEVEAIKYREANFGNCNNRIQEHAETDYRKGFLAGAEWSKGNNDPAFLQFVITQRQLFTEQVMTDGWWYEIGAAKRIILEDLLIAYDQMVERLSTAAVESDAVDFAEWVLAQPYTPIGPVWKIDGIPFPEYKTSTDLYTLYKQSLI